MFIVFINIVESLFSDIFPPFVFNNIMEVPFIFSPRVSSRPSPRNELNPFNFSNLNLFADQEQFG